MYVSEGLSLSLQYGEECERTYFFLKTEYNVSSVLLKQGHLVRPYPKELLVGYVI